MGNRAFGISFGVDVNVLNEAPGPHSIIAWNPGAGSTACGIVVCEVVRAEGVFFSLLVLRVDDCGRCLEAGSRLYFTVCSAIMQVPNRGMS